MSPLRDKEILDNNFTESLESFRAAIINILLVVTVLIGGIGILMTFQEALVLPFRLSIYTLLFILFSGLILYSIFIWINAKKYIFTPSYIILSSRLSRDKRIDHIKGFRYDYSSYVSTLDDRKEVTEIEGTLYIYYEGGSIKLDSLRYGNFYSIQKFIAKHYDEI